MIELFAAFAAMCAFWVAVWAFLYVAIPIFIVFVLPVSFVLLCVLAAATAPARDKKRNEEALLTEHNARAYAARKRLDAVTSGRPGKGMEP